MLHLPLRYEDETQLTPIADARHGRAGAGRGRGRRRARSRTGRAASWSCQVRRRRAACWCCASSTSTRARRRQLAPGRARARSSARCAPGFFGAEMVHPRYRVRARRTRRCPQALTPVYPTTAGLSPGGAARADRARRSRAADLDDTLPDALARALGAARAFASAVLLLHQPAARTSTRARSTQRTHPAWRRMKFDELLAQQLSMRIALPRAARAGARRRCAAQARSPRSCWPRCRSRSRGAQQRAWREIARDLAQPHPMQRLLQGDVGSGKTIVAALAALQAIENGWQAAVMAPTEILAEQHYRKFAALAGAAGRRASPGSSGSLKAREKRARAARRSPSGETAARGRHARAVPGGGRRSPRLGLAIVDEQHRFGVRAAPGAAQKGARKAGARAAPADDERDADPAHAVDELLRRPRRVGDRRAAAGPHAGGRPSSSPSARRDEVLRRVARRLRARARRPTGSAR